MLSPCICARLDCIYFFFLPPLPLPFLPFFFGFLMSLSATRALCMRQLHCVRVMCARALSVCVCVRARACAHVHLRQARSLIQSTVHACTQRCREDRDFTSVFLVSRAEGLGHHIVGAVKNEKQQKKTDLQEGSGSIISLLSSTLDSLQFKSASLFLSFGRPCVHIVFVPAES